MKLKEFFKKGSGELLGFILIAPSLILFVAIIVSAVQIGVTNQTLTSAAYNCGRAAVVSDTEAIAKLRAGEIYEAMVGEIGDEDGYVACEIELLDGEWRKGSYIRCTVRSYVSALMPFTSGVREQSIVMMIESGVV